MDKLKALEYFAASVDAGSFARAAQRLEVSVAAVHKLVNTLEKSLGVQLLVRGSRGVSLSPSGREYLDRCLPLLNELETLSQVERRLTHSADQPNGTLAVAAHPQLAHHVLLPSISRFHARYPEIELDLRTVNRISDADALSADVMLLHGWPEVPPDCVHRVLGGARSLIVAAPDYWAAHGVPQQPKDLASHTCLLMRNPAGILLDLWEFQRAGQSVQVPVKGWLTSNGREVVLDMVLNGHGVGRFTELTTRDHVQSGRLVPVLLEWEVQGGPPVNLLFKGSVRRQSKARVFIDYAVQCLHELQARGESPTGRVSTELPSWHRRGYGRASATVRKRR